MTLNLDFSLLPPMDEAGIFSSLDRDLESRFDELGFLNETRDRASGALLQFHSATGQRPSWENESYIRCGLAEFRSIDECLEREHRNAGRTGQHHRMTASRNPLIHLMALLRNVNLHARSCKTRSQETTVISHLGDPHEYTHEAVIIESISLSELTVGRAARRYDRDNIERALDWLLEKQSIFGVDQVFREGVEGYCKEFLSRYRN